MRSLPAHFERLMKILRRKGRSQEDAEDLIQEAMLRLHVYCQAAPVANEEAFLRQAVRNLSVDQYRRDRGDLRCSISIDDLDAPSPFIARISTPEEALESEQRLHNITALLDGLGRRTRDIYFAHRAGYSYAEIADHMGISTITIKRHIERALLAIMEHVQLDDDAPAQSSPE
jgi:RNA polymerase sigma-70 factor (ECF subfamily)